MGDQNDFKSSATIAVSLLALTAFGVFLIFLLSRLEEFSDLTWTRAIYLLSGIEAIVFAAAGFLFGKEVHRGQAQAAEARVQAEQARGKTLASMVLAQQPDQAPAGAPPDLVGTARRLYPDL